MSLNDWNLMMSSSVRRSSTALISVVRGCSIIESRSLVLEARRMARKGERSVYSAGGCCCVKAASPAVAVVLLQCSGVAAIPLAARTGVDGRAAGTGAVVASRGFFTALTIPASVDCPTGEPAREVEAE